MVDESDRQAPAAAPRDTPLLLMDHVSKHYRVKVAANPFTKASTLRSVDDVSVKIMPSETFALVGESGSGKSTLGRVGLMLTPPTTGRVVFDGHEISAFSSTELRSVRPEMQVIFQDPLGSLDPRMRSGQIVAEPLRVFRGMKGSTLTDRVEELFRAVGLEPSKMKSRPRVLSGGQRQRVGIARAIALSPKLILADEPVSALDVSVQAQIANLMVELRERFGLTYFFISHGLPIVRQISQRVGVMYLGWLPESGGVDEVFEDSHHPYTKSLLAASPVADPARRRERVIVRGEPPSPLRLPTGCRFRTRCPIAKDICAVVAPPRIEVSPGHFAECHFPDEAARLP